MSSARELVEGFVRWVANDGRMPMVDAIMRSGDYDCTPATAMTVLNDHLVTIQEFGIVVGSCRVSHLAHYARNCTDAPVPPQEVLDLLNADHPWAELEKKLVTT